MATVAGGYAAKRDNRFFLIASLLMAAVMVAGFSMQFAMGRSSFGAPPLVHAHAIVFFGWVFLYVAQNVLVANGSIALHRRLGWIAAAWMVPMLILGPAVTLMVVREAHVAPFFTPAYFLVMNPMTMLVFTGLCTGAIVLRRRTDWHRRLHFCGMSILLGPGFGRLLPMPLLIPHAAYWEFAACMAFPVAGVIADLRRSGRVHPAWWVGIGTLCVMMIVIDLLTYGGPGAALHAAVTAGTPGAAQPPLAYPPMPSL